MRAIRGERHLNRGKARRLKADLAAHARDDGERRNLIDVDDQRAVVPAHRRGANLQAILATAQSTIASICHREASAFAVSGDVDAAIVAWITAS